MRTSLARHKDFQSGQEILLTKTKPIRKARGIATVQLFDLVGKKVLESKTENLITDIGIHFLRRSIFAGMLSSYPGTRPPTIDNYFSYINLLDMVVEEKQEYSLPEVGNVIGYANTTSTYSGGDTKRGTINVHESVFDYTDYLHMHYVFDWPTHAANGTFRMIGWRYDTEVFKSNYTTYFASPDSYPYGLTWDGQYLWLAGNNQARIYKLNPSTGEVISSFASPNSAPRGLTWDGQYLWLAGDTQDRIYKLNPSTGEVISSFASPDLQPQGLTWDGQYLWLAGSYYDRIYKLNPSTGEVISYFASPELYPRGLTWDGQYLWLAGDTQARIYKLNPSTGEVISSFASPDNDPSGLAWDGQDLWLAGYNQDRIYKLCMSFGAITLLPAPVTKTSTNTMKVQYDFVFEL